MLLCELEYYKTKINQSINADSLPFQLSSHDIDHEKTEKFEF